MRYRILARELPESALRRIAREAVGGTLVRIEDADGDPHQVVHEVRKACTKIRALLRLFRPAFPEYSRENEFFRDIARTIADLRDAASLVECCDALAEGARPGDGTTEAVASVRVALLRRREEVSSAIGIGDRLGAVHALLEEARERIAGWSLESQDLDTVAAGFSDGYRRARKWIRRVSAEPTQENLHEWRKSVKVHRNHLRILRPVWPAVLGARHKRVKQLATRLGEEHDLAVLGEALHREPGRFDSEAVAILEEVMGSRRGELQDWALPEGRRLFAEKPKRVRERMRKGWESWIRRFPSRTPLARSRDRPGLRR
ncbi:MAG: CHAD domain-containing protein [Gemmatimonadota bacterium]